MSTSSAHADSEEGYLRPIEPTFFLKAQLKRMEETKQEGKLKLNDRRYKDNNVIWKMWGWD